MLYSALCLVLSRGGEGGVSFVTISSAATWRPGGASLPREVGRPVSAGGVAVAVTRYSLLSLVVPAASVRNCAVSTVYVAGMAVNVDGLTAAKSQLTIRGGVVALPHGVEFTTHVRIPKVYLQGLDLEEPCRPVFHRLSNANTPALMAVKGGGYGLQDIHSYIRLVAMSPRDDVHS